LEKAANNNHAKAQFHLARVYFIGMMGAEKDKEKGLFWMQAAALNGEKPAYFELGMRHLAGDGVEKNPEKGRIYLQELMAKADDKETRAQVAFKMGEIYALGGFGEVSPVNSWSWFSVAKELGHPDALRAFIHIDKQFGLSGLDKAKANRQAERCMETGYEICRPKNAAELAHEKELAEAIWAAMHPDKNLSN
jgi:TPR repeat protein